MDQCPPKIRPIILNQPDSFIEGELENSNRYTYNRQFRKRTKGLFDDDQLVKSTKHIWKKEKDSLKRANPSIEQRLMRQNKADMKRLKT